MKKILLPTILLTFFLSQSQQLKTPSEFLGYELGTEFTRHHEVVDYYEYVASTLPNQVKLTSYGQTYERRPLMLAFISTQENLRNLETIRQEHLESLSGSGAASKAIVWLSYNVHGNESVSTEASMKNHSYTINNKKFLSRKYGHNHRPLH